MGSNGISGLPNLDFMSNGMYPQSQQDKTEYAAPNQLPAGAQAVAMNAAYEAKTNPVTGDPMAHFNSGGIAALREDDGGRLSRCCARSGRPCSSRPQCRARSPSWPTRC